MTGMLMRTLYADWEAIIEICFLAIRSELPVLSYTERDVNQHFLTSRAIGHQICFSILICWRKGQTSHIRRSRSCRSEYMKISIQRAFPRGIYVFTEITDICIRSIIYRRAEHAGSILQKSLSLSITWESGRQRHWESAGACGCASGLQNRGRLCSVL